MLYILVTILGKEFGRLISIAFVICGIVPFSAWLILEETLGKTVMDFILEELEMDINENIDIKKIKHIFLIKIYILISNRDWAQSQIICIFFKFLKNKIYIILI